MITLLPHLVLVLKSVQRPDLLSGLSFCPHFSHPDQKSTNFDRFAPLP